MDRGKYWGLSSRVDSSQVYCYNELAAACTGGAPDAALVQARMNQNRKKNFFENPLENDRDFLDSLRYIDRENDEG